MIRTGVWGLGFGVWLLSLSGALAVEGEKINAAIRSGMRFLESSDLTAHEHGIGPPCLAGLALLEGGTPASHGSIRTVHSVVRAGAVSETATYQVSLAIIFLDRLGDPGDVGLIQILGARLLAGQTLAGGWGYNTFDSLSAADVARVRASLSATTAGKLNSEAARIIIAMSQGARASPAMGSDDNSNTQFGLIALWVSRRSGIPTDAAFARVQARFLRSQSPSDGGWSYGSEVGVSGPSMTCAGLLGLAAAKASAEGELVGKRPTPNEPKKPDDDDPFLRPPVPGEKPDETNPDGPPKPPADPLLAQMRERAIERGLAALGKLLQTPGQLAGSQGQYGGVDDLYFFWSLERVAVAYGLDTLGGVDWYKWGCEAIVAAQKPDGSWDGKYGSNVVSTSFALLFLKKANFTSDLSRKISGKVKDPGGGELRGGKGNVPGIPAAGTTNRRKLDDPKAASINPVRTTAEADKIAEGLVTAIDRDWPARLKAVKDGKGPQYTAGLSQAIAALDGKRLYQSREALAERLTRMNTETLKQMLAARDAEIRRAACLAVAMKDDRSLAPEVIDNITDPNDLVVRAAKASLKAMSGEDLGPAVGAGDDEKRTAASDWRLWFARNATK